MALKCLVETVAVVPNLLSSADFSPSPTWLQGLLSHTREDIRIAAATLLGAVASHTLSSDELALTTSSLLSTLRETGSFVLEAQHGTLLALASIVERRSFRPKEQLPAGLHKTVALTAGMWGNDRIIIVYILYFINTYYCK